MRFDETTGSISSFTPSLSATSLAMSGSKPTIAPDGSRKPNGL